MKAIILAAGEGKRLRPYTLDRPKCLVEIAGISLLDLQLEVMRSRGLQEIVLIGGYRSEMLRNRGSRLYVNAGYRETNMVWTLFCAEDELDGDLIVSYGDIAYSGEILDRLLASPADIAVAIDREWEPYWSARNADPLVDAESLRLASDGQILELGRPPTSLGEIQGQFMGVMKFTTAGLESLKSLVRSSSARLLPGGVSLQNAYMTDLLQAAIDQGVRVDSVSMNGGWIEVDTVSDLELPITKRRVAGILAEIG